MTTLPAAAVDAEGLMRDWLNTQTSDLVGPGKPLPKGVLLNLPRSPLSVPWATMLRIGGDQSWLADADNDRARLSVSIFGAKKSDAATAAIAYLNKLIQVTRLGGVLVTSTVKLQTIDGISGPLYIPTKGDEHYLVDADFFFVPAA